MSIVLDVDRTRMQDSNTPRGAKRCKIPQRLGQYKSPNRSGQNQNVEPCKKTALVPVLPGQLQQIVRSGPAPPRAMDCRPRSAKSAKSTKSSIVKDGPMKYPPRSARVDSRFNGGRRTTSLTKRGPGSAQRPATVITVQVPQNQTKSHVSIRNAPEYRLPSQEIIRKREDVELYNDSLDVTTILQEITDQDCEDMPNDLVELKSSWEAKLNQFEVMKMELEHRQRTVIELYATLRKTQWKMKALGEDLHLPSTDDLRIMNVAKVSPDQLLQLCANQSPNKVNFKSDSFRIDMQKFYEAPSKLVATCEQLLRKRQEIIDWFDSLKEQHGISMSKFSKKIEEFNAETQMLTSNLTSVKTEFLSKLNDIIDQMRKGMAVTMQFQVRTEELTYEISELNSLNADLRKQIHAGSHLQSQHAKHRLEELEKELKEEKCKKMMLKDRVTRAEGQIKISTQRVTQIEVALEQARSQNWSLERTVQHLTDQNQKIQADNDKELSRLTESIQENTTQLEEIAEAREKLQVEKDDLEKRLAELSESYNESMDNMKTEMNSTLARMVETERKYNEEREQRAKLEQRIEAVCTEVLESELRYTDLLNKLQEKESSLAQLLAKEAELEVTQHQLQLVNKEVEDCRERLTSQNETIKEIEANFMETIDLEKSLRSAIADKEEYIAELEKKDALLEQQLQENESKMESYVEQLNLLKGDIEQLQNDFGNFENLGQLHDMINEQRTKLNEVTQEKEELTVELKKKESEIDQHLERLSEQDNFLEERDAVINILKQKEEEHAGIISLLRNNLELRAQADTEIRNQLAEKNNEIESLQVNLDTRKQQISELEKIIMTLEDQLRKLNFQKRKDQDRMHMLEKALNEYESYHMEAKHSPVDSVDNLDNLIKVLEDELGTTYEPKLRDEGYRNKQNTQKYIGDVNANVNQDSDNVAFHTAHEKVPTKVIMGNLAKKPYLTTNDEQQKADNLDRKRAITQMDTPRSMEASALGPPQGAKLRLVPLSTSVRDQLLMRNIQYLTTNQMREDKKCKMFKLAGHRL